MTDDAFSRHLQDRLDDELMHLTIARNDMLWFCDAMLDLVMQVKEWLRGTGVSVSTRVIYHVDQSICLWPGSRPVSYEVSIANMKIKDFTAQLCPVAVYGETGARGLAKLDVTGHGFRLYRQTFRLSLSRNGSGWTIRQEGEPACNAVPLCKKSVISAIIGQ